MPDKNHTNLLQDGRSLSARYRVWLCDLWGVVHDGRKAFPDAVDALIRHRDTGGCVILITNAPRPRQVVIPQMVGFGVPERACDGVVSSGDVTRELVIQRAGQKVFHLGPEEDGALKQGLPVKWTSLDEADVVLCTGLSRDGRDGGVAETPEEYRELLTAMARRKLPFICANPDRVVGVGGKLYPCAGALADIYEQVGGTVEMAGKPHAPIYDVALARASEVLGRPIDKADVLAIGDGLPTDVEGARANKVDVHFITDGIHAGEHEGSSASDIASKLMKSMPGLKVAGVAASLVW
ncbi:MAG: TIGR01459 family HAD-type hydrolase [Anderseniella sp.]